jgi:hypothetical protein
MEELRLSAVATRVVAWHNTHPLARRITASQVHAIGYVALPFTDPTGMAITPPPDEAPTADAPAGGTLRERAQARARQQQPSGVPEGVPTVTQLAVNPQQLAADFSENFIDPLTPRQVERFARRHGQALVRAPADGPLRHVRADGRQANGGGLTLYLLTAVVETGTRKSRVLLGDGNKPAVLGLRVLAPVRVVAALLPLLAVGAAAFLMARPPVQAPLAFAAASAAASVPVPAVVVAAAASAASAPVPAVAAPAAPQPPASAPLDVEPRLGRIDMPSIRPRLGPQPKPPEPGTEPATAAAPGGTAAQAAAQRPAAPPAAAPLPPVAAFALSTRPLRTRAEADQVRVAMKSLLKAVNATEVHVDVLPEGDDWRVVGMPFASRGDADKARALLVSRGMRVVVVGF